MAGVAGPMWRRGRGRTLRFFGGMFVGGIAGGLVAGLTIFVAGSALRNVAPHFHDLLVAALAVALGYADIRHKTPFLNRQVPEQLIPLLGPMVLGIVWGADLALLITTQKAVSLLWIGATSLALLDPRMAPLVLVLWSVIGSATILAVSGTRQARRPREASYQQFVRRVKSGVGVVTLGTGVVMTVLSLA